MSNGGQLSSFDQGAQLTVRDILQLPHFQQTDVLGGAGGLDRIVASVNVMENPDIVAWVKAHELLITVGYSLSIFLNRINRLGVIIQSHRVSFLLKPALINPNSAVDDTRIDPKTK